MIIVKKKEEGIIVYFPKSLASLTGSVSTYALVLRDRGTNKEYWFYLDEQHYATYGFYSIKTPEEFKKLPDNEYEYELWSVHFKPPETYKEKIYSWDEVKETKDKAGTLIWSGKEVLRIYTLEHDRDYIYYVTISGYNMENVIDPAWAVNYYKDDGEYGPVYTGGEIEQSSAEYISYELNVPSDTMWIYLNTMPEMKKWLLEREWKEGGEVEMISRLSTGIIRLGQLKDGNICYEKQDPSEYVMYEAQNSYEKYGDEFVYDNEATETKPKEKQ